jgi:hypothetical protein
MPILREYPPEGAMTTSRIPDVEVIRLIPQDDAYYDTHLDCIGELLSVFRHLSGNNNKFISTLQEQLNHDTDQASDFINGDYADYCHRSVFQDASYSMAAVGMLAPFIESMFKNTFRFIENYSTEKRPDFSKNGHHRWRGTKHTWNCEYYINEETGVPHKCVRRGIYQLASAIGLGSVDKGDSQGSVGVIQPWSLRRPVTCGAI